MADPIPVPVGILRLPRGPDSSGGRGFSRDSRDNSQENSRDSRDNSQDNSQDNSRDNSRDNSQENSQENSRDSAALQRARAALRERFLRLLGSARGRRTRFSLWSGILLDAEFGAADLESGAFQVDSLQTPLGIQGSALLRSGDVLEFSFPLE